MLINLHYYMARYSLEENLSVLATVTGSLLVGILPFCLTFSMETIINRVFYITERDLKFAA